jgi:hypothetical protein
MVRCTGTYHFLIFGQSIHITMSHSQRVLCNVCLHFPTFTATNVELFRYKHIADTTYTVFLSLRKFTLL